jgi:homoserine acetyltransferase
LDVSRQDRAAKSICDPGQETLASTSPWRQPGFEETDSIAAMLDTAFASIGDLALHHGGVLRDARLAYVTYGTLAGDGRNAVLLTHGYTDALFPPALAAPVMAGLRAAGVEAAYEELDSPYGHLAPGLDAAKWAPALARLMASVA